MQGMTPSSITATGNGRNGVSGFVTSVIDVSADSLIAAQGNANAGVLGDNGTSVRLVNSSVLGNVVDDVVLSFGARGDISSSVVGTIDCDATALLRGDTNATCP